MSAYDAIARLYDPWSSSVVEDVAFYVEEAVRSGGPVVELGVGTGRIAIPTAAAGIAVIGLDASAEMLAVAREQAELGGVTGLIDFRQGDLRDPRLDGAFPLVTDPVPLAAAHGDGSRPARSVGGGARAPRAGRAVHLRRLHAERRGCRRDGRPVARAGAGDLGAGRLGSRRLER